MSTFRNNEMCLGRRLAMTLLAAGVLLVAGASATEALTTPSCLAKKLKEWGKLRKCQAIENGKALQGTPADPVKCQTKFNYRTAAISAQATAAAIACRYGVNGGPEAGTVTDYDTGLQWEQKTDDGSVHDKDNAFTPRGTALTDFLGTLNHGTSGASTGPTIGCFAEHCDWRLPPVEELRNIADANQGNCGGGFGPCIDQSVFGPTVADLYSSATSLPEPFPFGIYLVFFYDGGVSFGDVYGSYYVRAVRSGL